MACSICGSATWSFATVARLNTVACRRVQSISPMSLVLRSVTARSACGVSNFRRPRGPIERRAVDLPQRERIRDDLRGIVKGELLFDDLSRALYSTDASIFQIEPLGVAVPRDEEDVQALVRYAAERRIPLVPRGAGSGVAGEALGAGLIIDLSRHFRSIAA